MMEATVYFDGSCLGNPGKGGWACMVVAEGADLTISGSNPATTNNRMELSGAYAGIRKALRMGATSITVVGDSQYVILGMSQWITKWIASGWKTSSRKPVENQDAWQALLKLCAGVSIKWQREAGSPGVAICHIAATSAAAQQ